ncbi:MAG: endopeptidase La [Spirochaetia bacterium]|nr:endopeptidase La [Spirochaetia bacterium]
MKDIRKPQKRYPLLALRDTVIFPRNVSSLFVGREKSMEATRTAMETNRYMVLAAQKNADEVIPKKADIYSYGVLCEILQLLKMPDGTYKILVEGIKRVKIIDIEDKDLYIEAQAEKVDTIYPEEGSSEEKLLEKLLQKLKEGFENLSKAGGQLSESFLEEIWEKDSHENIIDSFAHNLSATYEEKQTILETLSLVERAEKVNVVLEGQIEISSLENSIHDRVRKQMDKMQRNYYLNEQIKVIREELGDGEHDEFDNYQKKIKEKKMPEEAKLRAEQELKKLEKMPPLSAESTVVRNYLDWILDLPWKEITKDNSDINRAQEILDNSHYGLEKVKDRILEFVAVRQLAPQSRGPILCLLGPPGVGKTSLAKSMAECLGRKFARISLGGVRDEAEIRGHRKTYIGAMPGRIISTLKRLKVKNPVILLDEIDKLSSDYRGNPAAALLEVLDPEQNKEFIDNYLELPFDLSQILFLATANVMHSIPDALLDRLEPIKLSGYTEHEKIKISQKFLLSKVLENNGIRNLTLKYSEKSLSYIIRHYTKEAGVRQLERELDKIGRKIAREFLAQNNSTEEKPAKKPVYLLDKENITKFLGATIYSYGKKENEISVGKCNGLAWTPAGGDILNIEIALAHGKGKISVTGNLGDVMKESTQTALGYIRSQGHLIGLADDFFDKTDIFIHIPEGAIPKDGPSAGIALATCLLSAITQTPIKNTVALTGEITLRGMVLPIGGLKEKTLAAFRGGITDIICPADNEKDMEDIPHNVKEKVQFHFVSNIRQVISLSFVDSQNIFKDKQRKYPFHAAHLPDWAESRDIKTDSKPN